MSDYDVMKDHITWENLKTIHKYHRPNGTGYELRIGRWVINGKKQELILGKQSYTLERDGFVKWEPKMRGLTREDLYRLFEYAKPISDIFGFPLPQEFSKAFVDAEPGQQELIHE